jgi:hypothetical protein
MALWSAALEAASRGALEVTVVTPQAEVASDLDIATRLRLREDMARFDVRFLTEHTVFEVRSSELLARGMYSGNLARADVDLVVGVWPRQPVGSEMAAALEGEVGTTTIGDALVPRDASAAIREGQEAALALETA